MPVLANTDPTFQPAMRIVTNITQTYPAQVTTSFDHDYRTGLIVRLYVPDGFGMVQIDKQFGAITVTGNTTFTIALDATEYDAFTTPVSYPESYQSATCVPIGEVNETLLSATQNVL
jgi:hypothetical protein